MTITITLAEALRRCNDWDKFCEEFGFSEYAVNEGGGDVEVVVTVEQAQRHGLLESKEA
jgi:hypothetical protein